MVGKSGVYSKSDFGQVNEGGGLGASQAGALLGWKWMGLLCN